MGRRERVSRKKLEEVEEREGGREGGGSRRTQENTGEHRRTQENTGERVGEREKAGERSEERRVGERV